MYRILRGECSPKYLSRLWNDVAVMSWRSYTLANSLQCSCCYNIFGHGFCQLLAMQVSFRRWNAIVLAFTRSKVERNCQGMHLLGWSNIGCHWYLRITPWNMSMQLSFYNSSYNSSSIHGPMMYDYQYMWLGRTEGGTSLGISWMWILAYRERWRISLWNISTYVFFLLSSSLLCIFFYVLVFL